MLSDREVTDRAEMARRERARWFAVDKRRHNAGDPEAYDANGVLKDGHSIRISMTDAKSPQRTGVVPITSSPSVAVPTVIGSNPEVMRDLRKNFYRDGTKKSRSARRQNDDFVRPVAVQDQQTPLQ